MVSTICCSLRTAIILRHQADYSIEYDVYQDVVNDARSNLDKQNVAVNDNYEYLVKPRIQALSSKGSEGKREAKRVQAELESKKKAFEPEAGQEND